MEIAWTTTESEFGSVTHHGRRGKARLFSVCYDGLLSKDHVGGRQRLNCFLPGFKEVLGHFETVEDAKARAENAFANWLKMMKLKVEDEAR